MDITCNLTFMDKIRHLLNPLHVYCRLTNMGISRKIARDLCRAYELCLYKQTIGRIWHKPPSSLTLKVKWMLEEHQWW